jgi:hypothetical protein
VKERDGRGQGRLRGGWMGRSDMRARVSSIYMRR